MHGFFWTLIALALVWACSRPAAEGAAEPGRPGEQPGEQRAALATSGGQPSIQDPCAEALRKGEATRVDAQGRPVAAPPAQAVPTGPDGSGAGPPEDPIPRLWLVTTPPTSGASATLQSGTSSARARGRRRARQAPQRVELQVLMHGDGACLEIFVEDRLRGRISTRPVPATGKRPGASSTGAMPRGVRELLRWPLGAHPSATGDPSSPDAPKESAALRAAKSPATTAPKAPRPQYALLEVDLDSGERRLELRAVGPGTLRLFGLSAHHRRPGVLLHNVGVIGAQVANALPGPADLLERQLRRIDPALVVVMLGTNDAYDSQLTAERFEHRFRSLINRLRSGDQAPDCLVLGTPDLGDADWRRARALGRQASMIRAVTRRVARAEGCAHWDLYAAMGGAGAMSRFIRAQPPMAYRDQVHLTNRGYRALGQLLYEGLIQRYAAYLEARPRLKVSPPKPATDANPEAQREEQEARRRWPTGLGPVPVDDLGGKALTRLFRALVLLSRKAPKAEARVLFLGDSHVAGDLLTGELRRRLQGAFGSAGHGYVHAGLPWPGYSRVGLRLGASGPWKHYYLRTRGQAGQPGDGIFGLGGVSTWITLPLPPSGSSTQLPEP